MYGGSTMGQVPYTDNQISKTDCDFSTDENVKALNSLLGS